MLSINIKKGAKLLVNFLWNNKYTLGSFLFAFLYATGASAEVFGALKNAGNTIFQGLKGIVFSAATIGLACVCIAGMFGNFNWKWLAAILLGVFIMGYYKSTETVGADLTGG